MTGSAALPSPARAGAAGPSSGDVPTGTRDEVLGWVGNDPARAQRAYDVEQASDGPRSTLLAELQKRGATG